jgi:(E)-4-hydroxy-3-methyl-but-2-enyl pyrophosphate reductase
MREVLKPGNMGFCFGVRRAVEMVLAQLKTASSPVYTLGPIIHNPQMVMLLKQKGVIPVENIEAISSGTVVFRTHGVRREEEEYVKQRGLKAVDATCPFVKRVRQRAIYLRNHGYTVVIVGDENHPEVKSVLSYIDNDGIVLQSPASIQSKKVGVVSQTTLDRDTFLDVVGGLIEGPDELRVYNTICESTAVRQHDAVALAGKVDVMLIVGGKNSSNTTKLYDTVRKAQPNTYHIETEGDIDPRWFTRARKVGITGGASTPDFIIDLVERQVKNL